MTNATCIWSITGDITAGLPPFALPPFSTDDGTASCFSRSTIFNPYLGTGLRYLKGNVPRNMAWSRKCPKRGLIDTSFLNRAFRIDY
jgi:hypothetical protein